MKKILVTMMVLALTIGAQAQQYDGINTYTYDYGLSGFNLGSNSEKRIHVLAAIIVLACDLANGYLVILGRSI